MTSQRRIMRRTRAIRRLVRKLVGEWTVDGGQRGILVRCHECGGDGLLHELDPAELLAMGRRARETPPVTEDRGSGTGLAGDIDGEIR